MQRYFSVGHSPDADDIFMYYALAFGWVSQKGIYFCNEALDIETLNQRALESFYDISAISFALYPQICHEYALLRTGISFGCGYGPKLIKSKNKILKKNFTVALSGLHTTNALLFKIAYPHARIVYKNFLDIEQAVLMGETDAGVLIHEAILEFDDSLCVEREVWEIWEELSGGGLPLPLGGMVIRRSIPLHIALMLEEMLSKAVRVAYNNPILLNKMLYERNLFRVGQEKLEYYLSLYANADSISLSHVQEQALDKLFEIGFNHRFYVYKILCEDYMLPQEYQQYRFS